MSGGQPATPQAAIEALRALPAFTSLGVSLFVIASGASGAPHAYAVPLSDEAAEDLAGIAEDSAARLAKSTLLAYGPAVLVPPAHAMFVGQAEAGTLPAIQTVVAGTDHEVFDPDAGYAAHASMVAVRYSSPSGVEVVFYRLADTLLQFTKKKYLGLIRRDGQYDRLEPADVLLMRAVFDVVVIGGFAFFALKPKFERSFGFTEQMKAVSGATFDTVTANLRIKGLDQLRAACTSQPAMMGKMASIQRSMTQDPAYAAAMTMPSLLRYIDSHPEVRVNLEGAGDDRELVFDPSPATRFQILKLLDDDYLLSVLTNRNYEANSKHIASL